jgi:hypothetical protein
MSFDGSENSRFAVSPRLMLGAAIALLGVLLTLDRFNLAVAAELLRFWPAAIIAVGLAIFVQSRKVGGGINGVIVMGVGGWLLLNSLGIVQVRIWQLFWPMVLMAIGSILVVQTLRHRGPAGARDDDTLTAFAVLSGVKRTSGAVRFRGGELTLFMGGGHIDLRQATIPRGEEAVIDIFAVMGGCEIIVPPSWTIATPLVPVMGGVEDKRLPSLPEHADSVSGSVAPPRLVLRGLVVMGGVQIKS